MKEVVTDYKDISLSDEDFVIDPELDLIEELQHTSTQIEQKKQIFTTLKKAEITLAYNKNGTLTIDKTQSKVESNTKFLIRFSRDLYWKQSLVITFIPEYKRIDPEKEYLNENYQHLNYPIQNSALSESQKKSKQDESCCEDCQCDELFDENTSDDSFTNNEQDSESEDFNHNEDSNQGENDNSKTSGNLRRLESSLLENLIALKVVDSQEKEVSAVIIKDKKVTNITRNSIEIKVEFENQASIKSNLSMQIYLNFSSFEKNWNDSIPFSFPLTPVLETKAKKSSQKSLFQAGATLGTIILTTVMIGSLSQLWGLVNGLQLIVHLPLILKATFPDQTQTVLDFIIKVAQFDLIDSRAWIFEGMLQMEIPEDREIQQNLERVKYDSEYTVLNLGTLFLLFVLFIIEAILLWFLKPVVNYWPRLKTVHDRLRKSLYWNQFLRLILEASIEISVSLINNIYVEYNSYMNGVGIRWLPKRIFFWINTFTAAGCLVILIFGPVFTIIFYLRRFNDWESETFETKFGSPLEGLRKDKKSSIFYPAFFIVRRMIFAFICIIMSDYFALQLIIITKLTLVQVCYLLYCRPFICIKTQRLEVMNEVFNLIFIYHAFALNTDWVYDYQTQEAIGWSFIFFIMVVLVIHLFFVLRQTLKDQEEKTFKQGTKANKCCLRIWMRCSKRIRAYHNLFTQRQKIIEAMQEAIKIKQQQFKIELDAEELKQRQLKDSAFQHPTHNQEHFSQLPSIEELSEIEVITEENKESSKEKDVTQFVTTIRRGKILNLIDYQLDEDQNLENATKQKQEPGIKLISYQDKINYDHNKMINKKAEQKKAFGKIYDIGMIAQGSKIEWK